MTENINPTIDPLQAIWAKRWELCVFALLVTTAAFTVSNFIPKVYVANATVFLSPPKITSQIRMTSYTLDSYEELVKSSGFLQQVANKLKKELPEFEHIFHPEFLGGMLKIESTHVLDKLEAGQVRRVHPNSATTGTMKFRVKGNNPKMLRAIASSIVNILSKESRNIRVSEFTKIQKRLKAQHEITKKSLFEKEKALKNIKFTNRLDLLAADLGIKKENYPKYKKQLYGTNLQIAELEGKVKNLKNQLKNQPNARIKDALAKEKALLQSLTYKKSFIIKAAKKLYEEIPGLQNQVQSMRLKEKRLGREIAYLRHRYENLSLGLEEARIAGSEKTSDVRFISEPTEPRVPVWPNKTKIVLIALVAGFVAGVGVILSKAHLENLPQLEN